MKIKRIWPVLVFGALAVILATSCTSVGIPAPDANHDGVVDPEFTAWKQGAEVAINMATGGATSPWLAIISTTVSGLAAVGVAVAHVIGKKDHAASVANIETIAKEAGVSESKLV